MIIEYLKTGRKKRMNPKLAHVLEKKGFVRILDGIPMEPEPFQLQVQKAGDENPAKVSQDAIQFESPQADEFDTMDRDALIAFAEENNLHIDRRWGEEKLRNELREQMQ